MKRTVFFTAALALGAFAAQAYEANAYVQPADPNNPPVYGGKLPTGTPLPKPGSDDVSIDAPAPVAPLEERKQSKTGLGLSISFPNADGNGVTVGLFRNSERRLSAYAGYTWSWHVAGPISAELTLGGMGGYRRATIVPMIMPSISYAITPKAALRLSGVPPTGKMAGVVHAGFDFKF